MGYVTHMAAASKQWVSGLLMTAASASLGLDHSLAAAIDLLGYVEHMAAVRTRWTAVLH